MNPADLFASAVDGEAIQSIARQFGLSTDQAETAMGALLPAFSAGIQQQAQSVDGMMNLLTLMGTSAGGALDGVAAAGAPMMDTGADLMTQIFGGTQEASAQVQAQVVQQAASMTGLGSSLLQKMLPMIASLVLSSLFKGAMNNGLGGLIEQVLKGGLGQPGGAQQGKGPMDDLLGGILGQVLGGGGGGQASTPQQADPMSAGIDILKGMFEQGQQVQKTQQAGLENIFDEILKAQKR